MLVSDREIVSADIRGIPQDVGGTVLVDPGHHLDAVFVRGFHRKQPFFGMPGDVVDIDELVMNVTEQHQIIDVVRQLRRPDRVAARAVGRVGDDMRDEPEIPVLGPRNQIANQVLVAARVLTSASGIGPQDRAGELAQSIWCAAA